MPSPALQIACLESTPPILRTDGPGCARIDPVDGDRHPARVALQQAREETLDHLSTAFAEDELGLDDLEARVDRAYAVTSVPELEALTEDLSPRAAPVRARVAIEQPAPEAPAALAVPARRRRNAIAVLGSVERRGAFPLEDGSRVVAVLGNVELDLREATLPPGVTTVIVRAILGNVELTVPPDMMIECEGTSVLGSLSDVRRVPPEGAGDRPVLRLVGLTVMGNLEIHTRPRGRSRYSSRIP